jgi:hypothetical protein
MFDNGEGNSTKQASAWQRLRGAYHVKQMTDTSFRATVIGAKVLVFALALAVVFFFALHKSSFSPAGAGASFLKSPFTNPR